MGFKLFNRDLSKPINAASSAGRAEMLKNALSVIPKPAAQKLITTNLLPSLFTDYVKKQRKEGNKVTVNEIVCKFEENKALATMVTECDISRETLERIAGDVVKKFS